MTKTVLFSGAYLNIQNENIRSYEAFYNQYTQFLPCFYKMKINNTDIACLYFKQHFQRTIQDYLILDSCKNKKGKHQYTIGYMMTNDIFVIFDESSSVVKILYHREKDEQLLAIIHFCMNFQ